MKYFHNWNGQNCITVAIFWVSHSFVFEYSTLLVYCIGQVFPSITKEFSAFIFRCPAVDKQWLFLANWPFYIIWVVALICHGPLSWIPSQASEYIGELQYRMPMVRWTCSTRRCRWLNWCHLSCIIKSEEDCSSIVGLGYLRNQFFLVSMRTVPSQTIFFYLKPFLPNAQDIFITS